MQVKVQDNERTMRALFSTCQNKDRIVTSQMNIKANKGDRENVGF